MQLNLERPDYEFFLRGANGHAAMVNERCLVASFIVTPDTLVEHWPVTDASRLTAEQLAPLFELEPEVIILGSGEHQRFPPAAAMAAALSRGIGVETMTNAAAARTFNVLAGEGRRVAAGFLMSGQS